ncbi:MAG: DNRLRE domain-containing protein [Planctomycetota bacterium]|jgi:hypothetical protein
MKRKQVISGTILFVLTLVSICTAKVITVVPSKDNTLYKNDQGSLSNGIGVGFFVGQNRSGTSIRRALLAFNLSNHIPAGSTIHSVNLTLHLSRTTSGPQPAWLHRVLADWGEGPSEAQRGGGGGADAAESDATWLHTFYNDSFWQEAGGDFAVLPSAITDVNKIGFYTWGSTPEMVSDVQNWVDNPASNAGWILIGNEAEEQTSKRFDSRETEQMQNLPMLTINFTPEGGCIEPLQADLNADCKVDFADLAILASHWLADTSQPRDRASITIEDIGNFQFDPASVETTRPDIFKPGHFSIFDILVHLHEQGRIQLDYHFSDTMNTHVVNSINATPDWWHMAYYDGGWPEGNNFRMDHYPYKDKMTIRIQRSDPLKLDTIYSAFAEEVQRKQDNDGQVIIPAVTIRGKTFRLTFDDILVVPHNLRSDTFQDGVITAMDVIMSLADQGKITYDLQWYDSIGTAGIVRSYWVERINEDQASGRCGFVYETGTVSGSRDNHIHIPSDWRVINSPRYGLWFWIELGSCD